MGQTAYRVRRAGEEDLAAVLAVHAANETGEHREVAPNERERVTWNRMMSTPDLIVYCAETPDGCVVGTASMITMPNITYRCAPTAFIEAVVTVPEHRRRGVATALLRRALDDAAQAGCNKIQLLSHKRHASDGAHALYGALGFQAEAEGFRLYLKQVPAAVAAARIM